MQSSYLLLTVFPSLTKKQPEPSQSADHITTAHQTNPLTTTASTPTVVISPEIMVHQTEPNTSGKNSSPESPDPIQIDDPPSRTIALLPPRFTPPIDTTFHSQSENFYPPDTTT